MTRLLRVVPGLEPFRHRNYALYWTGLTVSLAGSWIEMTATAYLLYAITASPVLLGLGGLSRAVPLILFSVIGGAVADRIERRRLLFFTQSAQVVTSLVLGVLVASGEVRFWHIYVIGFLNSTLAAFDSPARQAFFPSLVPRAQFQNAVALNSFIPRLSSVVGPAIAGLLIGGVSVASPFFVNAASYFAIIFALLLMRLGPVTGTRVRDSLRASAWGGIQYVRRSDILPLLLFTEASLSIFGHNSALVTIFARDVLHVGPEGLGFLLSAIGVGAIVGTVGLIAVGDVRAKGALMVGGGALYAAAMLAFALSAEFVLSVAILFVVGVADALWGAMRNTIAQLSAADAFRGRVMSLMLVVNRGLTNGSQLETGAIVALAGPPVGAGINALVVAAAVGVAALRSPKLRRFRSATHVDLAEPAAS